MPHCIIKVPTKISKLSDVSDFPAKLVGKDKATAGCVSVSTIEVSIYIVKCNVPAFLPEMIITSNDK